MENQNRWRQVFFSQKDMGFDDQGRRSFGRAGTLFSQHQESTPWSSNSAGEGGRFVPVLRGFH